MLDETQIKTWAENAAVVAYTVFGLDCKYSVSLINDPTIREDGLLDTVKNEIQLNLANLKPFPPDAAGTESPKTKEELLLDEDYRHALKVCYIIFHEMRQICIRKPLKVCNLPYFLRVTSIPDSVRTAPQG